MVSHSLRCKITKNFWNMQDFYAKTHIYLHIPKIFTTFVRKIQTKSVIHMKKSFCFALAVAALALFACTSKPAESEQQAEQQVEQTEQVEQTPAVEEPAPAQEPAAEPAVEEPAPAEEPAPEQQPAEEPAPEQPAEQPAEEPVPAAEPAPATSSEKYEILKSDGNFVSFVNEIVTADAEGCVDVAFVLDKKEESKVRLMVSIETLEGKNVGVFPIGFEPGGTKGRISVCASLGGVFSSITPGEQYKLSIRRAILQ